MTDYFKYCQEKAAKSGSSFYYSFLFLPPIQRQAVVAIYAFCREVDDIVDDCHEKSIAEIKLAWWREEIDRIYTGNPEHPIGKALCEVLKNFDLKKILFEEIIQGMAMDLKFQGYQTFDDLKVYCHCVASTVGLLAAEVFGYQDSRTLEYAKSLGIALQLVNIIRDIGEDARRGRIYFPEEDLAKFGLTPEEILSLNIEDNDKLTNFLKFQAERAEKYYQQALSQLPDVDRHTQRSGLIMAKIYFTILEEIKACHFNVLNQRVSITPIRKLWVAWKTAREEKKRQRTLAPAL